MDTPLPEHAGACSWAVAPACNSQRAPYQLTFLSHFPEGVLAVGDGAACEEPQKHNATSKRARRAIPRSITASDVALFGRDTCARPLLRSPTGAFLPALYARTALNDPGSNIAHPGETFVPADPDTITESATALLAHRLRRGVKILRDPHLLLRFLQIRLVSQPRPVFAMFFLDRRQRLIRFTEIFHGQHNQVSVRPKEVVREAIECNAELVLAVRSDPSGDHEPTLQDIEDARRVKRALDLLRVELMDYVIVGKSVTSLRARGVI